MKNQFLEEYLIYFKSELMLNSKLSHLSNSLIRSHSAITRKCSGLSEMAICVKVFCFRPNWALHNKIMVAGFIYNIFQKHQYCQILNFSKVKPTPLDYAAAHPLSHVCQFGIFFKDFEVSNRSSNGDCSNIFLLMYCAKWLIYIKAKFKSSKKCAIFRFWDWYLKCCQRAQKDSKVVQKRFWNAVSTCKRLSFTFQTQNFNLLATILSLIFEASRYSIFWVWKELLSDVSTIKKKWQLFWALPVGIVCGHTTFWPKTSLFQYFQASIVLEKQTKS